MIDFYSNPHSRGAMVAWMLEEIAQPYVTHLLDYGTTMKSPDYLAINPMGKVPAIVHDGQVVTEVAAICAYLADAFPEAGLAPRPEERAAYYRWLFFAAGPIEAAVTNRALGVEVPPERERLVGYGSFEQMVTVLEGRLTASPYIAGARFTAADVYVGSQVGWGITFKTLPDLPALIAYWDRLKDRPAHLRAQGTQS